LYSANKINMKKTVRFGPLRFKREADTIPTDAIPTDDRDRVKVLGIGLGIALMVRLVLVFLVTLLQSSFVGRKSVGIASVRTESVRIS